MNKIKQLIVLRKDLNMRKGKMVAQGAHAAMKVFFDRIGNAPYDKSTNTISTNLGYMYCDFTKEMKNWMNGSFTKVVVGVDSLEDLMYLKGRADEAKIPCALIEDSGLTEFKETCSICNGHGKIRIESDFPTGADSIETCYSCSGEGKKNKITVTCLAIGPASSDILDPITGDLELL